jgi:cardiolipin synthase
VWPEHHLSHLRASLLQSIAVLAPMSAAQYAWIVIRRISASETPTPASH